MIKSMYLFSDIELKKKCMIIIIPCDKRYHTGTVCCDMGQMFLRQYSLFDNINNNTQVRKRGQMCVKSLSSGDDSVCPRQSIRSQLFFKTWKIVFSQQISKPVHFMQQRLHLSVQYQAKASSVRS